MSIHRSTRRAEQVKELDRGTWADLDTVGFEFTTTGNGEAIAGPFYFGRAFDAPPTFSFSASLIAGSSDTAPQITVGVSEWILDEQEMYVGAWLWIVIRDCFDPGPVHGLVRDDDFENLLAVQGGGPEGDEIPYMAFTWFENPLAGRPAQSYRSLHWPSNYEWPDDSPSLYPVVATRTPGELSGPYRWVQMWGGLENQKHNEPIQRWRVSDAVSRSGQHSLHCDKLIPPNNIQAFDSSASARAVPANILACITYLVVIDEDGFPEGDYYREYLWGWRCEPGTSVKISGYRRHSWGDATLGNDASLNVFVGFYDENGRISPIDSSTSPVTRFYDEQKSFSLQVASGSWHYFEFSEDSPVSGANRPGPVAPPGTRYVRIEFTVSQNWLWTINNSTPIPAFETWLEDIKIELVGPQVVRRQPEFDVAVKFAGRLLKNYVGVHPLRSYEGPTRVVLS